ncbi:hypothetical protein ORI20_22555 [Mycobacterium sp. CVI_P3]|uniref:Transmembrane protein n=1 Tax=Mycobacterium pinniadriaticum TaxID=2994102 RepID=A0ABT3SIX5_9MYCO|nr:hypothetical protein [Mycobacterium pinniadriaticum]MCX2933057.1 hypothetical protein [Mycobacterium pinniadriaticum]MCX2939479.1 hypothetical protein [Mycobacterium pinniadriaticum]
MASDANVTSAEPATPDAAEQPAAPAAAEPGATPPIEPDAAPAEPARQRSWSMPKSPVTRKRADEMGRLALRGITGLARFVAGVARSVVHATRYLWLVVESVPPAVQLFFGAGVGMLLGVVGAITMHTTFGLVCIVVVVPVCAAILGALGHRWYSGLGTEAPRQAHPAQPAPSDLQRSIHYVDSKLATALATFGTDHHQQAVIALFQAKTAVELTLGTELDSATDVDVPLRADDYGLRPRIRAGSGSSSALRESNSLAAS